MWINRLRIDLTFLLGAMQLYTPLCLSVGLLVCWLVSHTLLFMIFIFWPNCSCPNGLVTSNMAPVHLHTTSVAVYPALFIRKDNQFLKKVWIVLEVQFFYVTTFLYLRFLVWEPRAVNVNSFIQSSNYGKEKQGRIHGSPVVCGWAGAVFEVLEHLCKSSEATDRKNIKK